MASERTSADVRRPRVVEQSGALREIIGAQRRAGRSIGLVPTMGALHEGHLSLVRQSRAACQFTAVSIFVNPTQFGPGDDLNRYPRTLDEDLAALESLGVDVVFFPSPETMYPPGFSTFVEPPKVAERWEGACRPGHFRGVATVVLKLLNMLPADVAFFGQKDYQQTLVVRHMVRDLNLPTRIQVCPIIREPDGLAMSSRNRYLDPAQRRQAVALWNGLQLAEELVRQGESRLPVIRQRIEEVLQRAGIERVDYVALVEPETLAELPGVGLPMMVLIAAHVGSTRLIDNHLIEQQAVRGS